jgi:hypothetical protein
LERSRLRMMAARSRRDMKSSHETSLRSCASCWLSRMVMAPLARSASVSAMARETRTDRCPLRAALTRPLTAQAKRTTRTARRRRTVGIRKRGAPDDERPMAAYSSSCVDASCASKAARYFVTRSALVHTRGTGKRALQTPRRYQCRLTPRFSCARRREPVRATGVARQLQAVVRRPLLGAFACSLAGSRV